MNIVTVYNPYGVKFGRMSEQSAKDLQRVDGRYLYVTEKQTDTGEATAAVRACLFSGRLHQA